MFCPVCGKPVREGAVFCGNCGARLAQAAKPAQPAPVQPAAPKPAPAAPKPRKKAAKGYGVPVALCSVVLLMFAAAFVLFIKPGFLMSTDDSSSKSDSSDVSEADASEEDVSSAAVTAATVTRTKPEVTTAPEVTGESDTVTEPEKTAPEETTAATTRSKEQEKVYKEAMKFSTEERPDFGEFEWCFGQYGLMYEPPSGAEKITDKLGYSGGWKAMIVYDPNNLEGSYCRELDNISIEVEGKKVRLTIDWYRMELEGELYDEQDMGDTLFTGQTTNEGITVSGAAEISINNLWKSGGKEYAVGAMITSEGLPAYVAMIR
ncbi:MAG: zinc ribbon domain-containing protein [Ruminococcus sp.]|nr:zinc ribbon domain-containing protein [Ruminococcus sp.]